MISPHIVNAVREGRVLLLQRIGSLRHMADIVDEISRKEKYLCPFAPGPVNLAGKIGITEIGANVGIRHLGCLISLKGRRKSFHIDIQMLHLLAGIAVHGAIYAYPARQKKDTESQPAAYLQQPLGHGKEGQDKKAGQGYDFCHHEPAGQISHIEGPKSQSLIASGIPEEIAG